MTGSRFSLLLALLTSTALPTAGAQTIAGQRVDSIAKVAVAGGFVVLVDAHDREVARTLVGRDGGFMIRVTGPGTYRLKSERIGYRASISPPFELARQQTLDYVFRVTPVPVSLAAVEVRDDGRCGTRPDKDTTVAPVWEEVRKALAAASWTERQGTYHVRVLRYERDLDARRRRVRGEEIRSRAGRMERNPFSSLPADRLASHGFIVPEGDAMWYYAPDAEILLDFDFLDTHCFRLVRGTKDRKGLIGLAFEPAPDRTLPEVDGTLWLDLQSAKLRRLEYRYTNMPYELQDDRVGGTVEFHQLPSSMWIVRGWQIRTPTMRTEEDVDQFMGRRTVIRLVGFRDIGGEVFEVSSHDGVPVFRAPMASMVGVVRDSGTARPLSGARVGLYGTDFETITDSAGTFGFQVPLEGDYEISLAHPAIESVGIHELRHRVALQRGETRQVEFRVPRAADVMGHLCPGEGDETRALFGVARRRGTGVPVAGASVFAAWQALAVSDTTVVTEGGQEVRRPELPGGGYRRSVPVTQTIETPGVDVRAAAATTDRAGFYVVCGLPEGTLIELRGRAEGLRSAVASVLFDETGQSVVHLGWDRRAGEPFHAVHTAPDHGWKLDLELAAPSPGNAAPSPLALAGIVIDVRTGQPIPGVHVAFNTTDTATSQRDGTFGFDRAGWKAGTNRVTFRRLGYRAGLHELRVASADTTMWLNVLLEPLAVELEEMVISGERLVVPKHMRGFYERRDRGVGTFLTRAEIQRRMAPRLLDILLTMPGVAIRGSTRGLDEHLYLTRAGARCRDPEPPIPPVVFVDGRTWGTILADDPITDLLNSLQPEIVVGIEVYSSPGQIPAEFNRREARCGAIVIWTN
jgi:hypothetical protein